MTIEQPDLVQDRKLLEALERERCDAIVSGDRPRLSALLDDRLVHVHGTGLIDDKDGYLAGIGGKYMFYFVERGPLTLCFADGCVIMVGALHQSFTELTTSIRSTVEGMVTQAWAREKGSQKFRLLSCHNSFLKIESDG